MQVVSFLIVSHQKWHSCLLFTQIVSFLFLLHRRPSPSSPSLAEISMRIFRHNSDKCRFLRESSWLVIHTLPSDQPARLSTPLNLFSPGEKRVSEQGQFLPSDFMRHKRLFNCTLSIIESVLVSGNQCTNACLVKSESRLVYRTRCLLL